MAESTEKRCMSSVVKSSLREKLFKGPASRLCEKLLPYLVDMSKNDTFSSDVSPRIQKAQKVGLGSQNSECDKSPNSEGKENGFTSNGVEDSTEQDSVARIDNFDIGVSSNPPNSNGLNPKFSWKLNASDPKGGNEGAEPMVNRNTKNTSTILSCDTTDIHRFNLSQSKEGTQLNSRDQIRNINGGISHGVDEYTEESIQTTPPHMDIVSDPIMTPIENEETPKKKFVIENNGFACEKTRKGICLKNGSNFKRKSVLNPCLQRKVFILPGSLGYRRLLPYLTDASNDNLHKSLDASKVKTDPGEKNTNTHSLIVDLKSKHTVMGKSEARYSSTEHSGSDLLLNRRTATPISSADSSDNKLTLISAGKSTELQKSSESENKSKTVKQVVSGSGILNDLEQVYGAESSDTEMTSPANLSCSFDENETIHRDDAQTNSCQGKKALNMECVKQKATQVKRSRCVGTKGILRKNPLGCRGVCNCLHCTSYRLNADRALEFSRNQLLDAEELAFNLIKELSGVRNVLKECIIKSQITADYQVMEACTKSQKAEESAICRLQEMKCDLSAHCKNEPLERSRVRFTNHVKEMLIPQVDS